MQPKYIYYVYAYLREDGTPYYIGKGKGKRAFMKHSHCPRPKERSRIVFLETGLSEIGSLALERRYIEWYGRKFNNSGILRNITEGGEGNSGPRSEEWRRNHSEKMMGRKLESSTISKIKAIDRSYMKTEEYLHKLREGIKKRAPMSQETKDKIAAYNASDAGRKQKSDSAKKWQSKPKI